MNYRDVCREEIWFTLSDRRREGRRFLRWAKSLGCVWMNGKEIDPARGTDFFTLAIDPDGRLYNVPAMARVSARFRHIPRVPFKDFLRTVSPC